MQTNFGANRGRKRRFAGDCAANSGLVDRIHVSGVPGGRHITRRGGPPQSTTSNIAEYRQQVALKTNLQGTLKTRYFSVYLVYVREKRCFLGSAWAASAHRSTYRLDIAARIAEKQPNEEPIGTAARIAEKQPNEEPIGTAARVAGGPSKGRHTVVRRVVAAPSSRHSLGRALFLRRATPGGCFFSGFFIEKTAFFLEKMEKNGILFQFGFLKQASTQTTEISLWRSGKTSRKS